MPFNLSDRPALSAVVPCYNEEPGVAPLVARLSAACAASFGESYEILLVDDGSRDQTWTEIMAAAARTPQVIGLRLARNSGHQIALSAGLRHARGEYAFILDADLQDPPELLPEMLALMALGNDVVYGQRRARAGETWFKRASARCFYRILSRLSDVEISRDTGDFRLISRRVLDALNAMPENHRFVRGMIAWIGFRQVPLVYDREPRFAGTSHYPLGRMLAFAADAITGFSVVPLRLATLSGALISAVAVLMMLAVVAAWLMGDTVQGWASLAVLTLFSGGVQLLFLGIIGEYVGRIYSASKQRPLYIVDRTCGRAAPVSETASEERMARRA
jgi:dolichol-phosphate mannosyltransferase